MAPKAPKAYMSKNKDRQIDGKARQVCFIVSSFFVVMLFKYIYYS